MTSLRNGVFFIVGISAVVEGFNPEKNGTKLQLVPLEAEFFAD